MTHLEWILTIISGVIGAILLIIGTGFLIKSYIINRGSDSSNDATVPEDFPSSFSTKASSRDSTKESFPSYKRFIIFPPRIVEDVKKTWQPTDLKLIVIMYFTIYNKFNSFRFRSWRFQTS